MNKKTLHLFIILTAFIAFGATACGNPQDEAAAGEPGKTGVANLALQYDDFFGDSQEYIGVAGTVSVYEDIGTEGVCDATDTGPAAVAVETTTENDIDVPFSLTIGPYCVQLTSWTLYFREGTMPPYTWQPADEEDVDLVDDLLEVSVAENGFSPVMFDFDWAVPEVEEDFGIASVTILVDTNACGGECGVGVETPNDLACAQLNNALPDCYQVCTNNESCTPLGNYLCLRGVAAGTDGAGGAPGDDETLTPSICVGPYPPPADPPSTPDPEDD